MISAVIPSLPYTLKQRDLMKDTHVWVSDGQHSVLDDTFPTLPHLAHASLASLQQVAALLVAMDLVALQLVEIVHRRHGRSLQHDMYQHHNVVNNDRQCNYYYYLLLRSHIK